MNPNFGFPSNERKHLGRKKKKDPLAFLDSNYLALLVLAAVIGMVLLTVLTIGGDIKRAHAEEVGDNRTYCIQWANGEKRVEGASQEEVYELCKEYLNK